MKVDTKVSFNERLNLPGSFIHTLVPREQKIVLDGTLEKAAALINEQMLLLGAQQNKVVSSVKMRLWN